VSSVAALIDVEAFLAVSKRACRTSAFETFFRIDASRGGITWRINRSVFSKRSVVDDVLRVVVVKFVFNTVEHHLVEKDLFREKLSVGVETVWKEISTGDG
jgi:hypothetical protein